MQCVDTLDVVPCRYAAAGRQVVFEYTRDGQRAFLLVDKSGARELSTAAAIEVGASPRHGRREEGWALAGSLCYWNCLLEHAQGLFCSPFSRLTYFRLCGRAQHVMRCVGTFDAV